MSQVGSGRHRLELRAVGLISVVSVSAPVWPVYGCHILLETGLSEENVCEWRKLFIRSSVLPHTENVSLPFPPCSPPTTTTTTTTQGKKDRLTYYAKLQSDRCACVLPGLKKSFSSVGRLGAEFLCTHPRLPPCGLPTLLPPPVLVFGSLLTGTRLCIENSLWIPRGAVVPVLRGN